MARYVKRLRRMPGERLEGYDDNLFLTKTVRNTVGLVNRVRRYGGNAVVLEPATLGAQLAGIAKRMVAAYA